MKIALIAHDRKKDNLVQFVIAYRHIFDEHELLQQVRLGSALWMKQGLKLRSCVQVR